MRSIGCIRVAAQPNHSLQSYPPSGGKGEPHLAGLVFSLWPTPIVITSVILLPVRIVFGRGRDPALI